MTDTNRSAMLQWTPERAILLAGVCLMLGIAGGWSIPRLQIGSQHSPIAGAAKTAGISTLQETKTSPAPAVPSPSPLQEMADAQAAPLLDKLKSDPGNPGLLTSIGNLYYDAQRYPIAVDYYARALKARPSDAAVRTDMGTAYWYMGNAPAAIVEFDKALIYEPDNPNTLFNRGLVKWKGKTDGAGALADWEKLLAVNPNYKGKDQVKQMMAEVKQHTAPK
jgi:cytochrome c-type biogenesis protein CcmH/NrfG